MKPIPSNPAACRLRRTILLADELASARGRSASSTARRISHKPGFAGDARGSDILIPVNICLRT